MNASTDSRDSSEGCKVSTPSDGAGGSAIPEKPDDSSAQPACTGEDITAFTVDDAELQQALNLNGDELETLFSNGC